LNRRCPTVNRSRHKVKYDTQCDKVETSEGQKVTCEAYFALHVSNMPHHFFTHGVQNTPQVKPTEDNCEAYFTQHVSNVILCRCQIYSVAGPFAHTYSIPSLDT
jgi:hypothetical protein